MAKISATQLQLGSGLEASGRDLRIPSLGVTDAMLAGSISYSKLALTGAILNADLAGSIETSKLSDGGEFLQRDGSVALTGALDANSQKITNLATPTAAGDAANKGYVDNVAVGLSDYKESVIALALRSGLPAHSGTGTGTLTASANGAFPAQDGVTLDEAGDRVLVWTSGGHLDDGIYELTQVGDGSNPWILTRASDADAADEITPGAFVFIEEGTTYGQIAFVQTAVIDTLGTDSVTWVQFSSVSGVVAGDGLSKSGNTLSLASSSAGNGLSFSSGVLAVQVDDATIEISGDTLAVKDGGIDEAALAGSVAGNGLTGGNGSALAVQAATNGGLQVGAGGVELSSSIDGDGISNTNGVLAVDLATTPGLEFSSGKLQLKVPADSGMQVGAGGVELKIESGHGLSKSSSGLAMDWRADVVVYAGTDFTTTDLTNADAAAAVASSHPMGEANTLFLNGVYQVQVADDTADPASGEWCFILTAGDRTKIRLGDDPDDADEAVLMRYVAN